jgi:hypothetical protein
MNFIVATLGEESGKRLKGFSDTIVACEKGGTSMAGKFGSTEIAVWMSVGVLEMVRE